MFSWVNFGKDENNFSNAIASNSQPDRFQSFLKYINTSGKISIPYFLGLNIPGIVQLLITVVYQQYSYLYPNFQPIFKAQKITEKTIETVQRKGKRLRSELENVPSETLICEGLLITTEAKSVNYEDFMILLIENKRTKQQLYNANRRIKRFEQKLDKLEYKEENKENKEDDINFGDQEETLMIRINNIIEELKLGSTILVSTEQFLSLILQQPCNYCGEMRLHYKKSKVSMVGFAIKILIICQSCRTLNEFTNESLGVNFNACVATAGLVGGINRQSL